MDNTKNIFIELGSCDYDTFIPLLKTGNWNGIFIEPVEYYSNSLEQQLNELNLKNSWALEKTAISNYVGEIEMNICMPENGYSRGLSFLTDTIDIPHMQEQPHQNWKKQITKVTTLDNIIEKNNIEKIDLLKIDIEGHELNVLENYSWKIIPNTLILEYRYSNQQKIKEILESKGYFLLWDYWNVTAIL